jgi:16S rRNA C1402 (ribose-2'-O) methylase RsmI
VANDLTKLYEVVRRGRLSELVAFYGAGSLKGEYTVVIAGAGRELRTED